MAFFPHFAENFMGGIFFTRCVLFVKMSLNRCYLLSPFFHRVFTKNRVGEQRAKLYLRKTYKPLVDFSTFGAKVAVNRRATSHVSGPSRVGGPDGPVGRCLRAPANSGPRKDGGGLAPGSRRKHRVGWGFQARAERICPTHPTGASRHPSPRPTQAAPPSRCHPYTFHVARRRGRSSQARQPRSLVSVSLNFPEYPNPALF